MKNVVDASAVLAICNKETGMGEARRLARHGLISAVNLHEVYYRSDRLGKLALAQSIVATAGLRIVPFDEQQAMVATRIAGLTTRRGVSLADQACLSLGLIQDVPIVTGDHKWAELGLGVQVVVFRPRSN